MSSQSSKVTTGQRAPRTWANPYALIFAIIYVASVVVVLLDVFVWRGHMP
jgi:hypothetical protein